MASQDNPHYPPEFDVRVEDLGTHVRFLLQQDGQFPGEEVARVEVKKNSEYAMHINGPTSQTTPVSENISLVYTVIMNHARAAGGRRFSVRGLDRLNHQGPKANTSYEPVKVVSPKPYLRSV